MFCTICNTLSISKLVALAEVHLEAHDFSQKAYLQHHESYSALVESADGGCEFCLLIYDACQETVLEYGAPAWEGDTFDAALQVIESRGYTTAMKVCINAGHLYFGQRLADVKLFDTLMVQAGDITPPAQDEDPDASNYENWIPPLELVFNVPRDKPVYIRNYQIGRKQTDLDLGSDSNFEIARSWLEECSMNHDCCVRAKIPKLPTRVIDVRINRESQHPRIFVSNEIEGQYVALSHCWDGAISPMLTTDNLNDFQTSIPFADLPANFRDAIAITKKLEIPYLWIDSLCIAQDSKEDWEAESKKMCSVYRDACVTIAADASSRSTDGIFRQPPCGNRTRRNVALKLFDDIKDGVVSVRKTHDAPQYFGSLVLESPLMNRGWTLQEGLLSLRVLHYGVDQIYWQCKHGLQSADGVPPGFLLPQDSEYPEMTKVTHSANAFGLPKHDVNNLLAEYHRIVEAYSHRRLSFDCDKLPAFAGIAEILHSALGGQYLAGVWTADLHAGLLWYGEDDSCKHVEKYRAPSWSWAATNERIQFVSRTPEGFEDNLKAKLLFCQIEPQGTNRYGQIKSGTIVMEGLTKNLVRSNQTVAMVVSDDEDKSSFGNVFWDDGVYGSLHHVQSPNEDYLLSIEVLTPTDTRNVNLELETNWQLKTELFSATKYTLLFLISMPNWHGGIDSLYRQGFGIVLAEIDRSFGKFRRVGYFRVDERHKIDFETWMQTWEPKTVAII